MILVVFLVMAGAGLVLPVLPLFARSFGVGYGAVGLLVSAYGLARLADGAADAVAVAPDVDVWAESGRGLALAGAIVDELVHEPNHPGNAWRLRQRRAESSA